jgi:leader peptidase (prepilin peptidase)/N-methyltransferase
VIAIWLGLPFIIRLLTLAVVGAAAGGLVNCILFACCNVARLTNPWAPPEASSGETQWLDRVPLIGWLRRREGIWRRPLTLEVFFTVGLPCYYACQAMGEGMIPEAIDLWIALPLSIRYLTLGLIGLVGGVLANYVIYTQAHMPRLIAPWAPAADEAPPRRQTDRIPVIGWLALRRESAIHGRGFWIRPLLIEVAMTAAFPLLYWYQTQSGGGLPEIARANPAFLIWFEPVATQIFLGHATLLLLMLCATFIDFDEQTIPDVITIPGTLIALFLAITVMSGPGGQIGIGSLLPTTLPVCEAPKRILPTTFDSPWFAAAMAASKWATRTGLLTGLAIWSGWCFALADRRFSRIMLRRRGLTKTIEFFFAALLHHWTWKVIVALWVAGALFISVIWGVGGNPWYGLFSSLVGLAVGGGTIWSIRIVASWAMDMEAMGFGDVTLMAMVGAFIGWQGAILGFIVSPFAAIAIVLIQYIVTRNRHVPFGPYLCAGTLLVMLFWDATYNQSLACNLQLLWPMLKWLAVTCLGLMGVMLFVSRMIKTAFGSAAKQ